MGRDLAPGEFVMGIDIGGTNIVAGVLDHKYNLVGRCKKKTHGKNRGQSTEERVIRAANVALEIAGTPSLKAIGIGSPGPLDPIKGIIYDTPNLAWNNFPLADTIAKAFGVPCAVDNDVNMGTYGEWVFGDLKNCKDVLGVFPGTGIGGGIIIDGKMLQGFSGSAGEIGHMTIEVNGPFCGCGKRGCLEAVASRIAIAEQVAALAARHDAPYIFENCGTDLANIRSSSLAKAIEAGDKKVEAVVRKAAYYIGIAVGNLVNVLSPEAVVLGGGLVEAMKELYLQEVERGMKEHALPFVRKGVKLSAAKLGDDAVLMGAAKMVLERLKD